MKTKIIASFCFLFVGTGLRKTYSQNKAATNKTENTHLLYIGIENPVTVAVAGFPAKELTVKFSEGIVKGNDGKYSV